MTPSFDLRGLRTAAARREVIPWVVLGGIGLAVSIIVILWPYLLGLSPFDWGGRDLPIAILLTVMNGAWVGIPVMMGYFIATMPDEVRLGEKGVQLVRHSVARELFSWDRPGLEFVVEDHRADEHWKGQPWYSKTVVRLRPGGEVTRVTPEALEALGREASARGFQVDDAAGYGPRVLGRRRYFRPARAS